MLPSRIPVQITANGGRAHSEFRLAARGFSGRALIGMPASYWLLLIFLLLVYANTPFVLPAAEIVRPAKLVAGLALLTLIGETVFGQRQLRLAWPEGALLIGFVAAAALSCLTALWPRYAAEGVEDLAKMALTY